MALSKKYLGLELYVWLVMAVFVVIGVFLVWYGNAAGILGVNPWG